MNAKRWIIANIILSCLLAGIVGFRILLSYKPQEITFSKSNTTYQYSVNINTADALHLQMIPGIGEVTAANIIEYREKNGNISNLTDLDKVRGIGPATLEKIEPFIKFFD